LPIKSRDHITTFYFSQIHQGEGIKTGWQQMTCQRHLGSIVSPQAASVLGLNIAACPSMFFGSCINASCCFLSCGRKFFFNVYTFNVYTFNVYILMPVFLQFESVLQE